jgi:drug/metabolite transporter (DMT)-like permease
MDSLGKILMSELPVQQVVWARFFFHAVFVTAIFRLQGHTDFLHPKAPIMQLLRGVCLTAVTATLYLAIKTISLAEATAFMYLSPVIITLLAGIFLGEVILFRHLFAVILGFIGVLIITKPGFREFEPAMLLAFSSSFLLALYFLLTSKVSSIDNPRTSLFYSSIIGATLLTLSAPLWWQTPDNSQWLLLILMGALGASGHFFLIKAYSLVSASALSPVLNMQIIAATAFSVFLFNDELQWNFFIGTGFIIMAGLFLWFYERYYSLRKNQGRM